MRTLLVFFAVWLGAVPLASARGRQGVVVIAREVPVSDAARSLARALYRDAALRPAVDEATVRAVLGEPVGEHPVPATAELGRLARAAVAADDPLVEARLFRSLGEDVGAVALVVVEGTGGTTVARIFLVAEGRFSPVRVGPRAPSIASVPVESMPEHDWSEAVTLVRALVPTPPPPAPPASDRPRVPAVATVRAPSEGTPRPSPAHDAPPNKPPRPLLTSPWFWGGLAAVVSVGVTVLVLSQTALKTPDTLVLDGRIAP